MKVMEAKAAMMAMIAKAAGSPANGAVMNALKAKAAMMAINAKAAVVPAKCAAMKVMKAADMSNRALIDPKKFKLASLEDVWDRFDYDESGCISEREF